MRSAALAMSLARVLGPHCPPWKFLWSQASPPHLHLFNNVAFQQQNKTKSALLVQEKEQRKQTYLSENLAEKEKCYSSSHILFKTTLTI